MSSLFVYLVHFNKAVRKKKFWKMDSFYCTHFAIGNNRHRHENFFLLVYLGSITMAFSLGFTGG